MAKAPKGGIRIGGKNYHAGQKLPDRYGRQLERSERDRDPAGQNPDFAPNMGRMTIPQVITFSGLSTSLSRAYRASDEALRHSVQNAHIMLNDPMIAGPLFARQCMTALLQYTVESEDDKDKRLKEVAVGLKKIVDRTPRFTELRRWLMEAIWYGRCASQHAIGFHTDRFGTRRRVIKQWAPVSGDKLLFRFNDGSYQYDPDQIGVRVSPMLGKDDAIGGRRELEPTGEGMGYFLKPWERRHWAVHKHMIRDGEFEDPLSGGQIHGVGLRHFLYWVWFQKAETMAQIAEVIERTGMGITIYYYPVGNAEAKNQVEKVAREQAHTNVLVMPYDPVAGGDPYGIQQIPPNTAGLEVLHNVVESFFGDMIIRFILGQTLSSKPDATGLGSSVGDLQKDSLFQIVRYDAVNLEETLTKELLLPLRDFNFPAYRNCDFFFKISTKVSAPQEELQAIYQAWQMGAKIRTQDLFAKLDMAMPDKDDKTVYNPQVVQAIMQIEQAGSQAGPPGGPTAAPLSGDQGATPPGPASFPPGMPSGQDQGPPLDGDPEQMDKDPDNPHDEKERLFGPILYAKTRAEFAQAIEAAAAQTDPNPTESQRESGNYKKGRVWLRGIEIAIENPKGSKRRPEWKPLAAHYGYVSRHSSGNAVAAPDGKDQDKVDCFIGEHPESELVFVIDQPTEGGRFDEHKCVIGATNLAEARQLYLDNYPAGWRCGQITALTWDQFRSWLESGDTTKPIANQPLKYGKQMGFNFDGPSPKRPLINPPGTFAEHQPGETKIERGKKYVLNENHRWELAEQPQPTPHTPVSDPTDEEKAQYADYVQTMKLFGIPAQKQGDWLADQRAKREKLPPDEEDATLSEAEPSDEEHAEESDDVGEQFDVEEPEDSREAASDDGRDSVHAGRGDDAGRSDGGGDRGRAQTGESRLVTAREQYTRSPADTEQVPRSVRGHLGQHQVNGAALAIEGMEREGGFLLADGTGAGKTRQILAVAQHYADAGKKVLILAPPEVLKPNWDKGTIAGSYNDDSKLMGVSLTLKTGKNTDDEWETIKTIRDNEDAAAELLRKGSRENPDYHYELLEDDYYDQGPYGSEEGKVYIVRRQKKNDQQKLEPGQIAISAYNRLNPFEIDDDTVLICDEAHALKNSTSQRGITGYSAISKAHAVLYATATPADKPLHIDYLFRMGIFEGKTKEEAYTELGMQKRIVTKKNKKTGEVKRIEQFVIDPNVGTGEVLQRMEALFSRMTEQGNMIKREISMQGVPVEFHKVELPDEAHEVMAKIEDELSNGRGLDDVQGLLKARILGHQRRQQEIYKIPAVVKMAQEELAEGRQVVVFMSRVNYSEVKKKERRFYSDGEYEDIEHIVHASEGTAKLLREALEAAGIDPADIADLHGGNKGKGKNVESMNKFQAGKAKIILATMESGGTGINLDDRSGSAPRTMLIMTAPFSGNDNVQAAGRIWRMSTKSLAKYRYIFANTRVDTWNAGIIGNKMQMLGAAVSGQLERLKVPYVADMSEGEVLTTFGLEEKEAKDKAKADEEEAQKKRRASLPRLAGSIKQVSWAEKLRKAALKKFDKSKGKEKEKLDPKLQSYLERIASAKFWIDNRSDSPEELLLKARSRANLRLLDHRGKFYVTTDFGEPIADDIRRLGGKWDKVRRQWEVDASRGEELKQLLRRTDGEHPAGKYAKVGAADRYACDCGPVQASKLFEVDEPDRQDEEDLFAVQYAEGSSQTEWVPYTGPKGGRGWQHIQTGRIVYGDQMPGSAHSAPAEPEAESDAIGDVEGDDGGFPWESGGATDEGESGDGYAEGAADEFQPDPEPPQSGPPETLRDVGDAGKAIVDNFYEAILKSLNETGEVPAPERKSSVGAAWSRVRNSMAPEDFVNRLRAGGPNAIAFGQKPQPQPQATPPTGNWHNVGGDQWEHSGTGERILSKTKPGDNTADILAAARAKPEPKPAEPATPPIQQPAATPPPPKSPPPPKGDAKLIKNLDQLPDGAKILGWTKTTPPGVKMPVWTNDTTALTSQQLAQRYALHNREADLQSEIDHYVQNNPVEPSGPPRDFQPHEKQALHAANALFGIAPQDVANQNAINRVILKTARNVGFDPRQVKGDLTDKVAAAANHLLERKPQLDAIIQMAGALGWRGGQARDFARNARHAGLYLVKAAAQRGYDLQGQSEQEHIAGAVNFLANQAQSGQGQSQTPQIGHILRSLLGGNRRWSVWDIAMAVVGFYVGYRAVRALRRRRRRALRRRRRYSKSWDETEHPRGQPENKGEFVAKKQMKTIYRASSDDQIRPGHSFAGRRSDAEAYLDNPGFGGPTLYRCHVDMTDMLDLTESPWESLSEALGESVEPSHYQYHFPSTITASDRICEALAARGYSWARIIDDYPEGCITYVPLTEAAADAAEEAMEEIEPRHRSTD